MTTPIRTPPNYTELLGEQGTAPPPDDNPYKSLLAKQQTDGATKVKQSMAVASTRGTPERWAKVLEISAREHLPTDVVDRNYDTLTAAHDRNSVDHGDIMHETPALGQWLQDPDNATLGRRELAPLQTIERGVKQLAPPDLSDHKGSMFSALGASVNDTHAIAWQLAAIFGKTDPATAAGQIAEANRRSKAIADQAPDYAKEFKASMAQHGQDVNAALRGFTDANASLRRGEVLKALGQFATGQVKTVGEALDMIGGAAKRYKGLTYSLLEGAGQMLPMIGGTIVGTGTGAATGAGVGGLAGGPLGALIGMSVGAPIGAVTGTFAGMAPVAVGQAITEEFRKRGVDVMDEASLQKAFSDPELMASLRKTALKKGLTVAGVTALFAGLAGKASEAVGSEASLPVKAAAGAADVGVQAGGQGVAQLAGGKAAGEKADPGAALGTAISMLGFGFGESVLGASRRGLFHADPVEAATEVHKSTDDALTAVKNAQAMSEVGEAIQQAPTTAAAPDRMKQLIETATGGKDATHVYFQDDAWDAYWTRAGTSPAKAAADIMGDGGKAYDRAKATGAPLSIPLADYVSKVGPSEHWAPLMQEARTVADGPSLKEAQEHLDALPDTMNELAQEAQGVPAEQGKAKPVDIKQQMAKQLTDAGMSAMDAKPQAQILESVFKTLGERAGIDPQELFGRYGLTVDHGGTPPVAGGESLDQSVVPVVPLPEGMYSKAERIINEKMGGSAKAEDVLKMLKNAGIKGDELKWTGLEELLSKPDPMSSALMRYDRGKLPEPGVVQKNALLDHMRGHRLNVQEVQVKNRPENTTNVHEYNEALLEREEELFEEHHSKLAETNIRELESGQFEVRYSDQQKLVVDTRKQAERELHHFMENDERLQDQLARQADREVDELDYTLDPDDEGEGYQDYTLPGGSNYREQLFTIPSIGGRGFAEGHFAEANIFAHLRMKDRIDAMGRKMLFAEEVQSDWGQQGRDRGFEEPGELSPHDKRLLQKQRKQEILNEMGDLQRRYDAGEMYGAQHQTELEKLEGDLQEVNHDLDESYKTKSKVADMPFKKNWHEFVMKRLLQYAVQHGYDAVGWTTGDTQVARYLVDERAQQNDPRIREKAEQINAGMKGFYDKILPEYMNKLGKKYGASVEYGLTDADPDKNPESQGVAGKNEVDEDGHVGVHEMVITPELRAQVKNIGFELFQAARGRITFGDGQHFNISLLEGADRSTFLHETGHLYLQVMQDLAKETPKLQEDYATIRDWVGAPADGTGFTREQHEQFARGFEAYLMEGKAPSVTLRAAFFRFKQWLTAIYHELSGLNVNLTPEVRKVFDRLIASDQEIAQAEKSADVTPLFGENAKAIGMNDEDQAKYATAVADAHQAAEEELTNRMMKDITREESKQWEAWSKPVREAVTKEVNANNTYQVLDYLRKGSVPEGMNMPTGMKLSKAALVKGFGKDILNGLPRDAITTTGGVHPDVVAELFGFQSGREMLDAMRAAPDKDALIQQRTNQQVQQEHGARMTPDEVQEQATAAVISNDKRAQLLRKELEILAKQDLPAVKGMQRTLAKIVPPADVVKAEAAKTIGAQSIGDIRPYDYSLAQRRMGKMAQEAFLAGDVDGAFTLKRKQILATALFTEATAARTEVEKAVDGFGRIFGNDEVLAKGRDMDLVNAARSVLARVKLGQSDTPPEVHLEQMQRYDPETYRAVEELLGTLATADGDYKELPLDTFRQVKETVDALWSLSRRTQQFEAAGKLIDRETVRGELIDRANELVKPANLEAFKRTPSTWDKTKTRLLGGEAALRRTESWADAMDGLDPDGVFKKYIYQPISDGATALRKSYKRTMEGYADLVKTLRGSDMKTSIPAPELVDARTKQPFEFRSKKELLGALWHTGNDSNLRKLLVGRGWGTVDDEGVLDRSHWDNFIDRLHKDGTLTKKDWDYVQGVWDTFEQLKPDAQRAHKDMFGHYFAEITKTPVKTPFGEYEGGYVPALVDRAEVPEGVTAKLVEALDHGFMFPQRATTGRSFTYARDEAYAKPLIMNPDLMGSHVDAVLRFTNLEPRVRDVNRITLDAGFRRAVSSVDPVANDMLNSFMDRAARQIIETPGSNKFADSFWRYMRGNAATQVLSGNVITPILMLSHFSGGVIKSSPSAFAHALWRFTRDPKGFVADIHEASDFMATRSNAGIIEIQKSIDNIMLDPSLAKRSGDWLREHGTFLMHAVQHISDHTTWASIYDTRTAAGASHEDAVRDADSGTRLTQGSFSPEDLSKFEAGTPFVRALSTFYSFFNAKANLMKTEFQGTAREMGLQQGAGRLFYVYTFGFMLPAVMAGMTRQLASGNKWQQDDEGLVHSAFKLFFDSQLEMATRAVPMVGPLAQSAYDMFAKHGDSSDEVAAAPVIKEIEAMVRVPHDVYQGISDKMTARGERDVMTTLGLFSKLPLTAIGKAVGYTMDRGEGRAQPTSAMDALRGLLTGNAGGR